VVHKHHAFVGERVGGITSYGWKQMGVSLRVGVGQRPIGVTVQCRFVLALTSI